ncbi:MAG: hypothetical protein J5741_06245 [Bacteroidales bacterium]|nr:hypothetical protein [Bacteroidales bacterium]
MKKLLLLLVAALIGISTAHAQHNIEIGYHPVGVAFVPYKKIQNGDTMLCRGIYKSFYGGTFRYYHGESFGVTVNYFHGRIIHNDRFYTLQDMFGNRKERVNRVNLIFCGNMASNGKRFQLCCSTGGGLGYLSGWNGPSMEICLYLNGRMKLYLTNTVFIHVGATVLPSVNFWRGIPARLVAQANLEAGLGVTFTGHSK